MSKIFSIPINPKLNVDQFNQFYKFLSDYKEYIRDIYFTSRIAPFMQDAMGDVFVIQEDQSHLIETALYIQRTLGIPISATFNNIQVAPTQKNLDIFIKNFKPLYDAGIRSATIPHTHWMATGQIKAAFPDLYVKNTILREVTTAQEVVNLAQYGFDYINLDRDLMRDHDRLREIKKAKEYIKKTLGKDIAISLLANEGCAGGCSMMEEHFHFNNAREDANSPQYFNDTISRVSCPNWNVQDSSIFLKQANFTPWREDWDEFINDLGIDSIKMHGREGITRLFETMEIVRRYAAGEEFLYPGFERYLEETNLVEKPINIWRNKIKTCRFECWDCNYCDKVYEKKSDIEFSELVKHAADCVLRSGVPTVRVNAPGLTSIRVQTLLNLLAQGVNTYLEIGAAQGATFCAVLKNNPIRAIAIDNWQQNIQPANGQVTMPNNSINTFIKNFEQYKGKSQISIIDQDLFDVDVTPFANSVGMMFYDGPHDEKVTKRAVVHYAPALTDEAIVVFDDANWPSVVAGAKAGIKAAGFEVAYEKLMLNDLEDPNAWWNGVFVTVIRRLND